MSQPIVGSKTINSSGVDGPFGTVQYQYPLYPYDFVFHADWADLDSDRNLPGVFTLYDLHVTLDVFPVIQTLYCLNVGPLLAQSEVEAIFLVTIRGGVNSGVRPKVGLLRASNLMIPTMHSGERLNRAVFGVIANGDMSIWNRGPPRMEATVRVVFPDHHSPPPASLIDFKSNRIVACVPSLFGHASISPHFPGFPNIAKIPRRSNPRSTRLVANIDGRGATPSSSRVVHTLPVSNILPPVPRVAEQRPNFGQHGDVPSSSVASIQAAPSHPSPRSQGSTTPHSFLGAGNSSSFFPRVDQRGWWTSHHVPADNGGERSVAQPNIERRGSLAIPGPAYHRGSWVSTRSPPGDGLSQTSIGSRDVSGVSVYDPAMSMMGTVRVDDSPSVHDTGAVRPVHPPPFPPSMFARSPPHSPLTHSTTSSIVYRSDL